MLLLCTNTMHKVADQVQAAIGIPLLHIADVARQRSSGAGLRTVGLLGTAFTMEQDFYVDRLAASGLTCWCRRPPTGPRCTGSSTTSSASGSSGTHHAQVYREVIERLVAAGAQGIILGCTEIELLITAADSPVPVFPTTRLHVEAAVDLALARH